jgi:Putative beta-lactamase-inhibitor-like, PepSY-like
MRIAVLARSVVSMSLLAFVSAAVADEEKVPLKDVPKPVIDAVKAKFPGAELTGAAKETEDGKTTYEVMLKNKGANIDASLTSLGKFVAIETELNAKNLPKAVVATIAAKYPKSTVKKAEEIISFENDKEVKNFEVILNEEGKKPREVKISPEGKVVHEEESDEA